METLAQDIKYATRTLINHRGMTLAAAFSLALGIGANTAIFTFVQGVFYPPLPAEDPAELVSLYTEDPPAHLPVHLRQLPRWRIGRRADVRGDGQR